MQYKPGNWVTGFKRSPRAANVQNRDMGLFLNSSGKFEPIDDSWDNLHSGGLFISDDNKLYFRDETNKDIYINSPAAETLGLSAGNATTAGFVTINEEGFDTDFRVEASGNENALFVRGSSGFIGLGTTTPQTVLHATGAANTEGTMLIAYGTASANPARASILRFSENPDNFQGGYVRYDGSANEIIIGGHDEADDDAANDDDILYVNRTNTTVGIGQSAPTTLLELNSTAPYLTIKNSTHEDGDGGRESKIIFEGEQSTGEITTLAQIQASHDGTSNDEKGDLIFSTNDGSDGASPTPRMRIDSAGNVGIGTDSPLVPLHVYTSGTSTSVKGNVSSTFRSGAAGRDVNIQLSDSSVAAYIGNLGGAVYIYTGSQQSLNIATDGDITVSAGNLVIGTAGKGIDFSAQTATATGATTAELLDHYEEGTWTAALQYATAGDSSFTYGRQTGFYTRIGRLVNITLDIRLTGFTKGTASGQLSISGLPFPPKNYAGYNRSSAVLGTSGTPFTGIPRGILSSNGLALIDLFSQATNAGVATLDDPDSNSHYSFTVSYAV